MAVHNGKHKALMCRDYDSIYTMDELRFQRMDFPLRRGSEKNFLTALSNLPGACIAKLRCIWKCSGIFPDLIKDVVRNIRGCKELLWGWFLSAIASCHMPKEIHLRFKTKEFVAGAQWLWLICIWLHWRVLHGLSACAIVYYGDRSHNSGNIFRLKPKSKLIRHHRP